MGNQASYWLTSCQYDFDFFTIYLNNFFSIKFSVKTALIDKNKAQEKAMNILKYIVNEDKIPVIFSAKMTHQDILQNGISAGFLILNYDVDMHLFFVKCFGESTSLNLKMSREDENIISQYLNKQFYNLGYIPEEIQL